MFGNYQVPILSLPSSQFTETLAQDQISANYNLGLPIQQARVFINGFTIVSMENLSWELWLFDKAANLTADPATDRLVGLWQFSALVAGQVGYTVTPQATGVANTLFRYHVIGNMIPYLDRDFGGGLGSAPALHVRLVNRSAAAKSADAAGAIQITAFVSSQGVQS